MNIFIFVHIHIHMNSVTDTYGTAYTHHMCFIYDTYTCTHLHIHDVVICKPYAIMCHSYDTICTTLFCMMVCMYCICTMMYSYETVVFSAYEPYMNILSAYMLITRDSLGAYNMKHLHMDLYPIMHRPSHATSYATYMTNI